MKKLFAVILAMMMVTSMFAWSSKLEIKDKGIPYQVDHIEFWNGGSKIYEADNATVYIEISNTDSSFTVNETKIIFYVYKVRAGGKTTSIVDSESLAIIYY